MLTEMLVRKGRAAKNADWDITDKIILLTDVHSEKCKNYFQNVFVFEKEGSKTAIQKKSVGHMGENNKFSIYEHETPSFPVIYPNGGNPLKAQGIYPIPCYLMYDPHIKSSSDSALFVKDYLLPRLRSTVTIMNQDQEYKQKLAYEISERMSQHTDRWINEDKQLGILMVVDYSEHLFKRTVGKREEEGLLWIGESELHPGEHIYLDGEEVVSSIVEAKFREAGSLGKEKDAVSTFTNRQSDRVVSVYNKSWLWLSPTWDMPKSIYWKDDEWTKGIRIDQDSYEAFLYGTQLLKKITTRIRSSILKEMFAPIQNAEAKKHISWNSFDEVYGAPLILPLLRDEKSGKLFELHEQLMNQPQDDKKAVNELHLSVLAGIDRKIFMPDSGEMDKYRLTLLYYSGAVFVK